jgi:hypothetical protein
MTTHWCRLEMWWEFARRNRHIAATTKAIERPHEEFQAGGSRRRRVLPSADTAACITSGDTQLNR